MEKIANERIFRKYITGLLGCVCVRAFKFVFRDNLAYIVIKSFRRSVGVVGCVAAVCGDGGQFSVHTSMHISAHQWRKFIFTILFTTKRLVRN